MERRAENASGAAGDVAAGPPAGVYEETGPCGMVEIRVRALGRWVAVVHLDREVVPPFVVGAVRVFCRRQLRAGLAARAARGAGESGDRGPLRLVRSARAVGPRVRRGFGMR